MNDFMNHGGMMRGMNTTLTASFLAASSLAAGAWVALAGVTAVVAWVIAKGPPWAVALISVLSALASLAFAVAARSR